MPSIHVVLECTSPTNEPDRCYHALVHVSDAELAAGEHVRLAARQASTRGFGGPHRFVASWHAVSGRPISTGINTYRPGAAVDAAPPTRLRDRLMDVAAGIEPAADPVLRPRRRPPRVTRAKTSR